MMRARTRRRLPIGCRVLVEFLGEIVCNVKEVAVVQIGDGCD
jgi:hypothetical protein